MHEACWRSCQPMMAAVARTSWSLAETGGAPAPRRALLGGAAHGPRSGRVSGSACRYAHHTGHGVIIERARMTRRSPRGPSRGPGGADSSSSSSRVGLIPGSRVPPAFPAPPGVLRRHARRQVQRNPAAAAGGRGSGGVGHCGRYYIYFLPSRLITHFRVLGLWKTRSGFIKVAQGSDE